MAQFLTPEIANHFMGVMQAPDITDHIAMPGPDITDRITLRMEAVIEEKPAQMIFTCMSHSPEAVKQCLEESNFSHFTFVSERASVSVFFQDDICYGELQSWASDAYGCGLISLPHIER